MSAWRASSGSNSPGRIITSSIAATIGTTSPGPRGTDRVRDLPFRGVCEVGLGAAHVCGHGQTRPARGANADDRSSDPHAIFDPISAHPAG